MRFGKNREHDTSKVLRLPRKTTLQPALKTSTRRGFAASPIDTATQQERQRLETNVGASKRAFRARLPYISHFAASKSTFSYAFSYEPTSKSTFCARLPSIFMTCHKMPRLPFAPCHQFAQRWQCDSPKNTQHDTSKVLRLPRKMTSEVSKALPLPRKLQRIFPKRKYCAWQTNHFWHVMKHVGMSQSAMPATRNEATRSGKTPKMTPFAELTRATAIATSREQLRTVANGCGRLRTVADGCEQLRTVAKGCATSGYTHTPTGKLEPLLRIQEKAKSTSRSNLLEVEARSRSKKAKNTWRSEHFWKLRCRKSARRCGAKHVQVKSVKNWRVRTTLWRSDVVLHGRRKGLWTLPKGSKTWGLCGSFSYNYNYATLRLTTLHYNYNYNYNHNFNYNYNYKYNYNYLTLHYTTRYYTNNIPLHSTPLRSITL